MSRIRFFWTTVGVFAALFCFLTTRASAGFSEENLPEGISVPVKTAVREAVQAGVRPEDAVQLVQAMHASRFETAHMLRALHILQETRREGLPLRPVINKALEGIAKQVSPDRTLQAMEAVSSRYAFAYQQVTTLTKQEDQTGRIGNVLAEGLAAGLAEPDAARIMNRLKEKSSRMSSEQFNDLAMVSLTMARDMSRLGVSSATASEVVAGALSQGFTASEISSMHQSMMSQSQAHSPQSLAQSYAAAVHQGQMPQGVAGAGHGAAGIGSGHGGSSGGGSAGGGGPGGSGGGSGGSGGGGAGGGGGGSGGGSGGGGNR